jgi:hypothetical protein
VILATRIEGQLTPVTVKLSYQQAGDLWANWNACFVVRDHNGQQLAQSY